jgi:hypothetical protein
MDPFFLQTKTIVERSIMKNGQVVSGSASKTGTRNSPYRSRANSCADNSTAEPDSDSQTPTTADWLGDWVQWPQWTLRCR